MIEVKDIAFTGYPVTDMARSRAFYEGVLGLKVSLSHDSPEMAWTEYDIGSNTLAIARVKDWNPSTDGATIALEVTDIDAAIAHLEQKGISFCLEKHESPVCYFCTVLDPDKNQIMIHQRKGGCGCGS